MKNGLAIWHYPHRSVLENVEYFVKNGFESVSILGCHMDDVCKDSLMSEQLAELIWKHQLILTVHHKLPASHGPEDVAGFKAAVDGIAAWQEQYQLLAILSFDVPQGIRDNAVPYIEYVLREVAASKVAVEDFGLTAAEKNQIEHLKKNPRFGYLLDIGHMYIRLRGENKSGYTLFTNAPEECVANNQPGYQEFLKAFRSKEFPVFEIHLHNNDGVKDLHYFLEDGTLDIQTIADVLRDIQFDGILTIESAPGFQFKCGYPESDERIMETYRFWKSCM